MEAQEWTGLCDRSEWSYGGPWVDEPDKAQWVDEATGLACLALRNSFGAWCGYVGLPAGHPWREKHYSDMDVDVHGGLTYGPEKCQGNICHVVEGDDDVRWIGFDTAHGCDQPPHEKMRDWGGTYKTLRFIRREVASLASQVYRAT